MGAYPTIFEFAYDAVGNRAVQTRMVGTVDVVTYTYNAVNRLISVNDQPYEWDNNGNLVGDDEKSYTYDQANRLMTIQGGGLNLTYAYNGDGARLKQIVNEVPTTYTLDLAAPLVQVLMSQDAGGKTAYLYGIMRIGEQQSAGWLYHLSDALGSVRQLTDGSGNVQLARGYTPYGEPLWTNGTASSRYAFTGEDYDPTVGLVFLRARYMQPRLGIFLAKDPWSKDQLRPGSMNGWGYVEGNPVHLIDPTGLFPYACNYDEWVQAIQYADRIFGLAPNAGEQLFQLFENDFEEDCSFLCAGTKAEERLDFILEITRGNGDFGELGNNLVKWLHVPLQFRLNFGEGKGLGDEGLAEEFRDSNHYKLPGWGGSGRTNQPAHFLTAVALSYYGSVLSEDQRLRFVVGHEMIKDGSWQDQYDEATPESIRLFLSAVLADSFNLKGLRDEYLRSILGFPAGTDADEARPGNSIEDLRLRAHC